MAGERVLFVDDEGQIRKLVQTFLTKHGYVVATANDGFEALREIKRQKPHLVITDVSMPNLNGLELCRRLRSEAPTPRMPVIMLSANKTAAAILAGHPQGADQYAAKRGELAALVTVPAVHQAIDRLKATSDYVLVDTAATFTQHTLAAIDGADLLAVVTSSHLASLKSALDLFSVFDKLGIPKAKTLLVLNRVTEADLQTDQVTRFFGRKPDVIIPFTASFDDAADSGKPLVSSTPSNVGAMAVRDFAAQITVAAPVQH